MRGTGGALGSLLREDEGLKRLALAAATDAAGLSSEAALQTMFTNLQRSGRVTEGVTYDDFLANLVSSAMSRGIAQAGTGSALREFAAQTARNRRLQSAVRETGAHQADALRAKQQEVAAQVAFLAGNDSIDSLETAARVQNALVSGTLDRLDLNVLYATDADTYGPLLDRLNDYRQALNVEAVPIAIDRAWGNLLGEYSTVRDSLQAELDAATTPEDRALIRQSLGDAATRYEREIELLQQDVAVPGSSKRTSDVDRSVGSPYLRNALKDVFDEIYADPRGVDDLVRGFRGLHEINPDGTPRVGPSPSTARAADTNEYYNLFSHIDALYPMRSFDTMTVPDSRGLTHADAVEANSLATLLMTLTPVQRAQLERQRVDSAPAADRARVEAQFAYAKRSLAEASRELQTELARLAREEGRDPSAPDTVLRARDNLYGQRTLELHEMYQRLKNLEDTRVLSRDPAEAHRQVTNEYATVRDRLTAERQAATTDRQRALIDESLAEASRYYEGQLEVVQRDAAAGRIPERLLLGADGRELAAEIMRKWNVANREGIEAYSDLLSINAIVQRIQIPRSSVRAALGNDAFNAGALGYTSQGIDGLINDQFAMIMHHVNGYHGQHEGVLDAANALAKYSERLVLGHQLRGHDIEAGAYGRLDEMAGQMMAVRGQPNEMRRVLERFGGGDADAGLLELFSRMESTLPGAEGIFGADLARASGSPRLAPTNEGGGRISDTDFQEALRRVRAPAALQRERERERTERLGLGNDRAALRARIDTIATLEDQARTLQERQAREAELAVQYLPRHWRLAERLEAELASNQLQRDMLARCLCGLAYIRDGERTARRNSSETNERGPLSAD